MEEVENHNITRKAIPITFGSCITISLDNYSDLYLSTEGFVNSRLHVEKFDQTTSSNNFVSSVFRVLPFSSAASFKNQNKLYQLLQDFFKESRSLSKECKEFDITESWFCIALKDRKNFIQELKTNLDSEINSNILAYNKLKGTPVLLGISAFQLVHLSTMKYLSLNDDNKDNLL